MLTRVHIKKNERGLWFRDGDLHRVLAPGDHRVWTWPWRLGRDKVELFNTLDTQLRHPMLEALVKEPALADLLRVVELNDHQRALVWRDDRLFTILGPGRHAFWREPAALRVETFDISQFHFNHERLDSILAHAESGRWLEGVVVDAAEEVLLFRDGKLLERLGPGRYVYWKGTGRVSGKTVDRREQVADVAGQEIMTSDKVTLRVNLLVTYQVADAVKALTAVSDHAQSLYREAQLVLRAAVGTRPLDALLADKESIGAEVRDALAKRVEEFGLAVRSVGLRDIVLPGEMKAILNQVIEAEKQAQANLIKRREETAAARSQANTARLLAENPALARMKELEHLQEILAGAKATFFFGDGDIAKRVRTLIDTNDQA